MPAAKPIRGQSSAPKFTGDPKLLKRFFQDLEAVFAAHNVQDLNERIRDVKHYAEPREEEVFEALTLPANPTWEDFKKEAIQAYPGAEDEHRYTQEDLNLVAAKFRRDGVVTKESIGQYYRDYNKVAHHLITRQRAHAPEVRRIFLEGFPEPAKSDITLTLRALNPARDRLLGFELSSIRDAALQFVAASGSGALESSNPVAAAAVAVKKEEAELLKMFLQHQKEQEERMLENQRRQEERLFAFMAEIKGAVATTTQRSRDWNARITGDATPRLARSDACSFCSEIGHYIRDCPTAGDYIKRGILTRDAGNFNRLALTNGAGFPMSFQGRDMREKLEAYLRAQAPRTTASRDAPPHIAEAHMFECGDTTVVSDSPGDTVDLIEALVQHAHNSGKGLRFDGVEIRTGPPRAGKKSSGDASKPPSSAQKTSGAPLKSALKTTTTSTTEVVNGNNPGFKYSTPIEDPAAITRAVEALGKTTIALSTFDLLSISPAVRKEVKDRITARRVSVGIQESFGYDPDDFEPSIFLHEEAPPSVGHLILTLRQVTPLVGGATRPECILDPGSMIVAMRKDIWMRLGAALDMDSTTTMQSANLSLNSTMGVIPAVSFDFDGVILRLPVHVVDNAPYEVLLGRPFFALGTVTTQDYRSGDQFITVRDPDTGTKVTIPTIERKPRRKPVEVDMVEVSGGGPGDGGDEGDAAVAERSILYVPQVENNNKSSSAYLPRVLCEKCLAGCKSTSEGPMERERNSLADGGRFGEPHLIAEVMPVIVEAPTAPYDAGRREEEDGTGAAAAAKHAMEAKERELLEMCELTTMEGIEEGDYVVYESGEGMQCVEVFGVKKYKKVANKVVPVSATLPEEFRITRREPPGILEDLEDLPRHPPEFVPGRRYTAERREETPVDPSGFLWPEERKLAEWVIKTNEDALAWTEHERGAFRRDCFDPIMIPTIPHTPWVLKNIPIPKGIYDKVCEALKTKIETKVYESSNSSYRSRWFCVVKKDKVSLRIVHDLQPLNRVTIRDVATLPYIEDIIERSAGRACYGGLDLLVAFDHRELDERSRDLTTFQTPFGAFRLTVMPMGYTNSVPILQGDVSFIFKEEIPANMNPFADDCNVLGPPTRYERAEGGYETIPENQGIRRFVWEHFATMHRCLHRMKRFGGTFSGKKLYPCVPRLDLLGQTVHDKGRSPDMSKVQRIVDWPECETVTEVRGFLGTCGLVRVFVANFSHIARPLVKLTRKDAPFEWGSEEAEAMARIKAAVQAVPDLTPIDYRCGREIVLAVDSSRIAVGFILLQAQESGPRRPSRFGSIAWNDVESRYSQPKLEIYGVWRALRASRAYLAGVEFVVEVDAKFIKDMINNPDTVPSATINRWIAGILLFTFQLRHVPAKDHQPCDGLSRRRRAPGEEDDSAEAEEYIDTTYSLWMELANPTLLQHQGAARAGWRAQEAQAWIVKVLTVDAEQGMEAWQIPQSKRAIAEDERVAEVQRILEGLELPPTGDDQARRRLLNRANKFFVRDGKLWRRDPGGRHKVYVPEGRRGGLLKEAHDDLGHRGRYVVRTRLAERFWWPSMDQDIVWFLRTCDICQKRQFLRVMAPPRLVEPAVLFMRWHVDTMKCPTYAGYTNLIHARESLCGLPEARPLRRETGKTVAVFIHEQILCRYGAVAEIITDNGPAIVAAIEELARAYGIRHIKISAYNSRANGVVERRHRDVRETLAKMCGPAMQGWTGALPAAMWAERCTVLKAVGKSPFEVATGQPPRFPFDLKEANWLGTPLDAMSTTELIAARARQLQRRAEDLAAVHQAVTAARARAIQQLEATYSRRIKDFDFKRGDLVLVRNSRIEMELDRKAKERYMGPYVVFDRGRNGNYRLAEVDGAVHRSPYAASRVIPYFARSTITRPLRFVLTDGDTDGEENIAGESDEDYVTAAEDDSDA